MRLPKFLFAIALCLILPVVVFAHPGRTDSSGGHYDRSTGEYHYHHGYPAHEHSDMDGDGILDCPYLFEDKTGSSSRETEPTRKPTESPQNRIELTENNTESKKDATPKRDNENDIFIGCGIVLVFFIVAYGVSYIVDAIKRKRKTKRN